jgi:hypothetical protein
MNQRFLGLMLRRTWICDRRFFFHL